jgi:hypothetical protein
MYPAIEVYVITNQKYGGLAKWMSNRPVLWTAQS